MARYIDAEELKDEYYELHIHGTLAVKSVLDVFVNLLDEQPTADVVEVVRCKDCLQRLGKINSCGGVYCNLHKGYFDKDGYCNYGKLLKDERKDA